MSEPKTLAKPAKVPKSFTPRFWEGLDGRVGVAKEIRRRYELLRDDTGADRSAQRDMLCQRAVFIGIVLETMEVEAMDTGNFDAGGYVQATNGLLGILKALGLDKKVQSVTDLKSYLAQAERAG